MKRQLKVVRDIFKEIYNHGKNDMTNMLLTFVINGYNWIHFIYIALSVQSLCYQWLRIYTTYTADILKYFTQFLLK